MNIRARKIKEISYPNNLFMDITDAEPTREAVEGLLFAVRKLSSEERELIELCYEERLPISSVAERLGMERAVVIGKINLILRWLSSPMMFNYIKYGRKKWEDIASLAPAERMKKISALVGKPIDELDASYLELPRSVYSALCRSHRICEPYTVGDAVKRVFDKPYSRLIPESDRRIAEELLRMCGAAVPAEKRMRKRSCIRNNINGYPRNLYTCIFGADCPEPDSDMLKGLAQAVSEIPEPGRQVIILLYEKSISYKEVSERLSLPPDMVRQHESRALRCLRRGDVRRKLRYGAQRSKLLSALKNNRKKALNEPLEKIMTASAAEELAQIGAHTLAQARNIDPADCSAVTAYELNDIISYLEI